ncbi:MAG: hypothetical protein VX961_04190 [Verrucomicrobiota bacterium]|nr:hypothetical protein [Verrucomicrobiota bacterium]
MKIINLLSFLLIFKFCTAVSAEENLEVLDIGDRRELFVDNYILEKLEGNATQKLHHPVPREIVFTSDKPWEGNGLNYVTVLKDGDNYKMYYRGGDYDRGVKSLHEQVYCLAISKDGIKWTRPKLGLVEFEGSKDNNIILTEKDPVLGYICHNFSPFLDANPKASAEARYKAVGGGPLFPLVSADGIQWKKATEKPIITKGAFDSQNLAFWDSVRSEYRAYHREFRNGRDIMTETSDSFTSSWTKPVFLEYTPDRGGELYTNQIMPYERAPHIFIGFPTRYEDRGLTPSTRHLPQWKYRQKRSALSLREGTAVTEGLFMSSRDGLNFHVFQEAFIRPGLRTKDSWFYGDNYQNNGLVETKSSLSEDAPPELSMYLTEATLQNGKPAKLRRYSIRMDGFASISAPMKGGKIITKLLKFSGNKLSINYSSSARGGIRVGILNQEGKSISGYNLKDCPWIYGDSLDRIVEWNRSGEVTNKVSSITDQDIKLVFELKDADLFSFKFEK